jgi:hypothetical protein
MKNLISLIAIASLLPIGLTAAADTNSPSIGGGVSEILKATGLVTDPTNYAAVVTVGRSLHGNQTSAALLIVENVNNNIGVIAGVDHLWGGGTVGSANIVAGGLTLKTATHPLAFLSSGTNFFTTLVATPFATLLAGTPLNGTGSADGGLAAIARTGVEVDVYNVHGWELGATADYGNRTGSGTYNGNWIDLGISVRKGF